VLDDGTSHDQVYGPVRNSEALARVSTDPPVKKSVLRHLSIIDVEADEVHAPTLERRAEMPLLACPHVEDGFRFPLKKSRARLVISRVRVRRPHDRR
jgi:hypothetical protein